MITITDAAKKEFLSFFSSNPDAKKSVRIFVAPGGCCGPVLSMALDEASGDDETEEIEGVTFCMTKDLFAKTGAATIDLGPMGFQITTEHPFAEAGGEGGCSSCGGGCHSCH